MICLRSPGYGIVVQVRNFQAPLRIQASTREAHIKPKMNGYTATVQRLRLRKILEQRIKESGLEDVAPPLY